MQYFKNVVIDAKGCDQLRVFSHNYDTNSNIAHFAIVLYTRLLLGRHNILGGNL
jgi:hypothetical protein